MIKDNWRTIFLIISSAALMTIITAFDLTGSRPFENTPDITTYDGKPCVFKEYGYPFKSVSTVEEPCVYALRSQEKPSGLDVGYMYIDLPILLLNFAAWGLLFSLFYALSRKLSDVK